MTAKPNPKEALTSSPEPVVLFERIGQGEHYLGVVTLNRPRVLNSLDLEMASRIKQQLLAWSTDESIVAVVLKGAGERAFCAGGDVAQVYHSIIKTASDNPLDNDYAVDYFKAEYSLDYYLHCYPKPVIVWGQGVVMGGGVGLLSGASHRIVSEDVRLAFPEVSIGLFPDVGGSWLLPRLTGHTGRFLAATGATINANDVLYSGMADYVMNGERWHELMAKLTQATWPSFSCQRRTRLERDELIHRLILEVSRNIPAQEPEQFGPLQQHHALIHNICSARDYRVIYQCIADLTSHDDSWLAQAAQTMLDGSPFSVALALTLQDYAVSMSLQAVFELEYIVALHCCVDGIFQEGVRALLIDKDKCPQWPHQRIEDIDINAVYRYFKAPEGLVGLLS